MSTEPITNKVAVVRRRLKTQRALDAATALGALGAIVAAALLVWSKLQPQASSVAVAVFAIACAGPLLGALFGSVRPLPTLLAAQLIDRSHDLRDRFASAMSFASAEHRAHQTPFEAACIRQALQHAPSVDPKRAAPLQRPRYLLAWLMALSTLPAVMLIEQPTHAAVVPRARVRQELLSDDDLNAFKADAAKLQEQALSPELQDAAKQLNALLEQLANRDIDRETALRQMRALEDNLQRASQAHPEALKDALGALGRSLDKHNVTKTLAKALQATDPKAAAAEAQALAKRLRDNAISRQEHEAMRAALARASKAREGQSAEQLAQRREEMQRLLQREREKRAATDSDRRLLKRRERELERLQRQEQRATEQERQLERLQREMDQAAQDLSHAENEQAAQDMDRAAEELNRMAREQMTDQQREQMRQQLQQLREMLRRQQQMQGQGQNQQSKGQQGAGQRLRLDQFTKLAQGQGQQGQQGNQQQGQQGQGQQPGQGDPSQGQGQPGQQGQGQQPGDGTKTLVIGPNGSGSPVTLEIPGMGGTKMSQRSGSGGDQQGHGSGGPQRGAATDIDSDHVNTRVEGEQQAGPSRSQIIEGASSQGFAARGYEKVFTDYQRHAESVIERDEIPGGYRFYVRRYFQLIRPRESKP